MNNTCYRMTYKSKGVDVALDFDNWDQAIAAYKAINEAWDVANLRLWEELDPT